MSEASESGSRPSEDGLRRKGFAVTRRGQGFHLTFANGWTVSVQFGPHNYSDNYNLPPGAVMPENGWDSDTAEIAAWDGVGKWFDFGADTVAGYKSADEVAKFIAKIARKKPAAAPVPDGSEPCTCGPTGYETCDCGHTSYWHSHSGTGDCEHDGECSCRAFEPWTNVEHFSDCDGEWPCSCVAASPVPEEQP